MAVNKEIVCLHCKRSIPFGQGFTHDEELNLICFHCGKVIFAVTEDMEVEVKKVAVVMPTTTAMGFHSGWARKEPLPIKLSSVHLTPDEAAAAEMSTSEPQTDDEMIPEGFGCYC